MNIAERIYKMTTEEATEIMLYRMKGWHVFHYTVDKFSWKQWPNNILLLKFKKGGKVCFKNGYMKQDYNW